MPRTCPCSTVPTLASGPAIKHLSTSTWPQRIASMLYAQEVILTLCTLYTWWGRKVRLSILLLLETLVLPESSCFVSDTICQPEIGVVLSRWKCNYRHLVSRRRRTCPCQFSDFLRCIWTRRTNKPQQDAEFCILCWHAALAPYCCPALSACTPGIYGMQLCGCQSNMFCWWETIMALSTGSISLAVALGGYKTSWKSIQHSSLALTTSSGRPGCRYNTASVCPPAPDTNTDSLF